MSMIEIPEPDGHKVIGWGSPRNGQPYIGCSGIVLRAGSDHSPIAHFALLEPIETWRDATFSDLGRMPLRCRVSETGAVWREATLAGFSSLSGEPLWLATAAGNSSWRMCQVLDEGA